MERIRRLYNYFTRMELWLWFGSALLILLSFLIFDGSGYLTLLASLIGITSLIFNAKGNPFGQVLMVVFSLLYGLISYGFSYYGEMITYLGMTLPMAVFALVAWLRHPYKGKRAEVQINSHLPAKECLFATALTLLVTGVFYFILSYFNTVYIIPSTVSVTTSFIAVYLTFRRSPYYALAYAANDIVLIVLWILASLKDPAYLSVVACFVAFLVNDVYAFYNWGKILRRQKADL